MLFCFFQEKLTSCCRLQILHTFQPLFLISVYLYSTDKQKKQTLFIVWLSFNVFSVIYSKAEKRSSANSQTRFRPDLALVYVWYCSSLLEPTAAIFVPCLHHCVLFPISYNYDMSQQQPDVSHCAIRDAEWTVGYDSTLINKSYCQFECWSPALTKRKTQKEGEVWKWKIAIKMFLLW